MRPAIDAMRADADRNVMPLDGDRAFHTAIVQAERQRGADRDRAGFLGFTPRPAVRAAGRAILKPSIPGARPSPNTRPSTMPSARATPHGRARGHAQHLDKSHARFSASWRRAKKSDPDRQQPPTFTHLEETLP
jgi:hypothetical protein